MIHRQTILTVAALLAVVVGGALVSPLSRTFRLTAAERVASSPDASGSMNGPAGHPTDRPISGAVTSGPDVVKLSVEAIENAGIGVATTKNDAIIRRIVVPGTIVPPADHIAHVAVKLSGIVAGLRKNIGDAVEKNEVVAVLESRDVADAKSDYLTARLTNGLQQDLFERDQMMWKSRAISERQFLLSRNDAARTKIQSDNARQKLFALGLTQAEIEALPSQPEETLRLQEIRSPIAGHIVERKAELGIVVGRDDLATELFVVADLDRVWVELAVGPQDASLIRVGQSAAITASSGREMADGKVIFVSPILDKDTRAARVVAEIDNRSGMWRPGLFVTAAIAFEERPVSVAAPVGAIQTMDGRPVVFVRTSEGFQKRPIVLGESDERNVEVASGLQAGETIAVINTFLLKAEMLKGAPDED